MGVAEADNVFSALTSFPLDADELLRIDVIAIVRRVIARIASPGDASDGFGTVVRKVPQQHAAAFVRVGFFAVLTKRIVNVAGNGKH